MLSLQLTLSYMLSFISTDKTSLTGLHSARDTLEMTHVAPPTPKLPCFSNPLPKIGLKVINKKDSRVMSDNKSYLFTKT